MYFNEQTVALTLLLIAHGMLLSLLQVFINKHFVGVLDYTTLELPLLEEKVHFVLNASHLLLSSSYETSWILKCSSSFYELLLYSICVVLYNTTQ